MTMLFVGSKKLKDGSKKRKLGRNPRVPFTQHQVTVLEHKFHRTHYLSSVDVAELSAALNLTENRVSDVHHACIGRTN
jgi:homeobox protein MSX